MARVNIHFPMVFAETDTGFLVPGSSEQISTHVNSGHRPTYRTRMKFSLRVSPAKLPPRVPRHRPNSTRLSRRRIDDFIYLRINAKPPRTKQFIFTNVNAGDKHSKRATMHSMALSISIYDFHARAWPTQICLRYLELRWPGLLRYLLCLCHRNEHKQAKNKDDRPGQSSRYLLIPMSF